MATNETDPLTAGDASYRPELARLLAADDYTLRHLATHLHTAGRRDRLHRLLLSNPAWMEAKFRRLGDDTAYQADLALAIGDYADPLAPTGLVTLV